MPRSARVLQAAPLAKRAATAPLTAPLAVLLMLLAAASGASALAAASAAFVGCAGREVQVQVGGWTMDTCYEAIP